MNRDREPGSDVDGELDPDSNSAARTERATPLRGCFVTGTDTEVGKTRISAALLHLLAADGRSTAGLKPVAAGTIEHEGHQVNDDVIALRDAGSLALGSDEVGPYQFAAACAPHIAAALEGRVIDRAALVAHAHALGRRADRLVVEGVGGFRVPLGDDWDSADLAADLGLPVILVVGLRLGCLNHALLAAAAVQARGLRLAGWVGNHLQAGMPWANDNIDTLRRWLAVRHDAPCLGIVPWLADPRPSAVAAHLDAAALRVAIAACRTDRID